MSKSRLPNVTEERPFGYYHVREGDKWLVAKWLPSKEGWQRPGFKPRKLLPPDHFDEVKAKVA